MSMSRPDAFGFAALSPKSEADSSRVIRNLTGSALGADPGTSGSCAEGTTRQPPTGRSGHNLPARVAVGFRELEAVGQLESGDHQNRPRQDAGARSPPHLRLAIPPGRRRPSAVAESYGARVHYRHGPHIRRSLR